MTQAYNYRCSNRRGRCQKRYRLRRPLDSYRRRRDGSLTVTFKGVKLKVLDQEGRCAACHRGYLRPVNHELREQYRKDRTCDCGLPPWPHREGSTAQCPYHPDWEPT